MYTNVDSCQHFFGLSCCRIIVNNFHYQPCFVWFKGWWDLSTITQILCTLAHRLYRIAFWLQCLNGSKRLKKRPMINWSLIFASFELAMKPANKVVLVNSMMRLVFFFMKMQSWGLGGFNLSTKRKKKRLEWLHDGFSVGLFAAESDFSRYTIKHWRQFNGTLMHVKELCTSQDDSPIYKYKHH